MIRHVAQLTLQNDSYETVDLYLGETYVGRILVAEETWDFAANDYHTTTDEEKLLEAQQILAQELRHVLRCVQ